MLKGQEEIEEVDRGPQTTSVPLVHDLVQLMNDNCIYWWR